LNPKLPADPIPFKVLERYPVNAGVLVRLQVPAVDCTANGALTDAEAQGGLTCRKRPGVRSTGHGTPVRRPICGSIVHSRHSICDQDNPFTDPTARFWTTRRGKNTTRLLRLN
jgi:hypothetical protein